MSQEPEMLLDREVEQLQELKRLAEAAPLRQFLPNAPATYQGSSELDDRTRMIGDYRITYLVAIFPSISTRQLSISTPGRAGHVPVLMVPDLVLNQILAILGFKRRVGFHEDRSDSWVQMSRFPTLNVIELIGETDAEFAAKILGAGTHMTPARPMLPN